MFVPSSVYNFKLGKKLPGKRAKPDCKKCFFYRYSFTLGSSDVKVWHCLYGFTPRYWIDMEPSVFDPCYTFAYRNYCLSHEDSLKYSDTLF